MAATAEKTCNKCEQSLPLVSFDKKRGKCKQCRALEAKERYDANPQLHRERNRISAKRNPRKHRPTKRVAAEDRVFQPSPIEIDGDLATVHLATGGVAIVDASDVHIVSAIRWRKFHPPSSKTAYATGYLPNRTNPVYMHRLIMGVVDAGESVECDHRNHDGLDNRQSNLRLCNHSQNSANRRRRSDVKAPYIGVSWKPKRKKWVALVTTNGRRIEAGAFAEPIEAARAFDRKAREVHGEFATLNFPQEVEFNG